MSGNISDPSTWAPPGESASDLWLERSNFNSVILSGVTYGVHFTLFVFVVHHLIRHPTSKPNAGGVRGVRARVSWPLVAYVSWNFMLGTFGIAAEAKFNEMTFVDDRNFPGGPNAFVAFQYNDFVNMFGTAAYVVLNWFCDGLVIYRFWLIYNFNVYLAILPCLMLLGSVSMGIMLLFQLSQPNANLWTTTAVNFAIPYWSISTSLNILVTSLIVLRLLAIRSRTRAALSRYHARTYTSVAAMLVESAALYSCTALLFIITYARNSSIQNLVLPPLGQVQAICPLLIMWRVARGQAISREAFAESESGGPSALSWRRTAATGSTFSSVLKWSSAKQSQTATSTTAASSGRGNSGQTESGFSEPQNVSLPPLPKEGSGPMLYEHKYDTRSALDDDIEPASWELEHVPRKGTFGSVSIDLESPIEKEEGEDAYGSREVLRKVPGVEVTVERHVERWEER